MSKEETVVVTDEVVQEGPMCWVAGYSKTQSQCEGPGCRKCQMAEEDLFEVEEAEAAVHDLPETWYVAAAKRSSAAA